MIFNSIGEAGRLHGLHPGFPRAFEFLGRAGLEALPAGTYELDGRDVYAMIQEGAGGGKASARLETHRKYIDIQFTVKGAELFGCGRAGNYRPDARGWDFAKDICFFDGPPEFWLPVPEGCFAIFYPEEDLHAPMAGQGAVRKVVVKVKA